jgi:dephospho-CoA kinase
VLNADGSLDRHQMAGIVFSDAAARRDLESIIHPLVEKGIRDALTKDAGTDAVVVVDVALLVERNGRARYGLDGVIVVDADEETCRERLRGERQMSDEEVAARMASQIDRFERLAAADFAILNVGSTDELTVMVENAWTWIRHLREELGR